MKNSQHRMWTVYFFRDIIDQDKKWEEKGAWREFDSKNLVYSL